MEINSYPQFSFKVIILQRVKKVFFGLLRKVLNFVFLRVGAVRWYRPRAKNEKRQKCCKFNTYSIFKPHRQHFVLPPLLRRRPLLSALQTFPPINGGITF